MANKEHLELLKQGPEAWDRWRWGKGNKYADLRGADLSEMDLDDYNFRDVDLSKANLVGASINRAYLIRANFVQADLSKASFGFANLTWANLKNSNLTGASFQHANLSYAELDNAEFTDAQFGFTSFGGNNLSKAKGLASAVHEGPSSLGVDTIFYSNGNIPEAFLRGVGLSDEFIAYIHSLVVQPIQFYSCFISYSSKDQKFADRLYADLQARGIRCWFAPEDWR